MNTSPLTDCKMESLKNHGTYMQSHLLLSGRARNQTRRPQACALNHWAAPPPLLHGQAPMIEMVSDCVLRVLQLLAQGLAQNRGWHICEQWMSYTTTDEQPLLASWKGQLRLSMPGLHFLGPSAHITILHSECTSWLCRVGLQVLSASVINVNNKRLELISSS